MADDPENLMPGYLRRLDAKLDQVIGSLREQGQRLSTLDQSIVNLHRDDVIHAENTAMLHARVDRLSDRIERIERRLDLAEPPIS